MAKVKMYICVLNEVPSHMVPCVVGHAVLNHHLSADGLDEYLEWLHNSYRKCVVSVGRSEFEKIRMLESSHGLKVVETRESKTLGGEVCCLTVVTTEDKPTPNVLSYAKLWRA